MITSPTVASNAMTVQLPLPLVDPVAKNPTAVTVLRTLEKSATPEHGLKDPAALENVLWNAVTLVSNLERSVIMECLIPDTATLPTPLPNQFVELTVFGQDVEMESLI